jgi:hypothetical protein
LTRDWKSLLKESKGLLVAICISLLLHSIFIGQFFLDLPTPEGNHPAIEAELALATPAKPKPNAVIEPSKTAKPRLVKPKPAVLPEPTPEPNAEAKPVEDHPAVSAPEPVAAAPVANELAPEPAAAEAAQEDTELVVNQQPYQYVDTEFDVRTDINASINSSPAGKARMVYKANDGSYELSSLIQPKGLAALILPDLLQNSKGSITNQGLRPTNYLYQFGDKKDRTYKADFDWQNSKLVMHTIKGDRQASLGEGAQDLLSFMYQFMFVAPMQSMQLAITNGKKLNIYDYAFEGEETIATKMGDIKTIHILRTSDDDDKDELWLALDYQYVPVKIRKTEKDKVYELLATSLKTEKPPI